MGSQHDENGEEKRMRWWERVVDFNESKKQLIIALPMILVNLSYYLIRLGMFAIEFIQNILRFFQTQCVVVIPMICALIPLLLHVGIAYVFVHLTGLGYRGAPLAASVSLWISLLMLVLYLKYSKQFKLTYTGLSSESFTHVFPNLALALHSAAMVW